MLHHEAVRGEMHNTVRSRFVPLMQGVSNSFWLSGYFKVGEGMWIIITHYHGTMKQAQEVQMRRKLLSAHKASMAHN